MDIHSEKILILDFGSQYTQLIARRVREAKVYCEIHPYNCGPDFIRKFKPKGIILSGGPSSVYDKDAPILPKSFFDEVKVPILGICYGMQLTAKLLGGKVVKSRMREYGPATIFAQHKSILFEGVKDANVPLLDRSTSGFVDVYRSTSSKKLKTHFNVWMSHGDSVNEIPAGFKITARSISNVIGAIEDKKRNIYGVQFHPEVVHTPKGDRILRNFVMKVCGCRPVWTMKSFIDTAVKDIRTKVGDARVVCGISGGVDSAVAALLVHRAIGSRLTCIFVDNGVLRKGEAAKVESTLKKSFRMNIKRVDASARFLKKLKGVEDPEKKRKIIGGEFVRVFEEEAGGLRDVKFLAQGTLYPDVIESVSFKGPSATIKSHHNVGGLLKKMKLGLVEPLRELFKDEVRKLGRELGMPEEIVNRHPFPGPGLAIRIIGEVTAKRCEILREADAIVLEEIKAAGLYGSLWQSFAVLLPIKTVGVMGDERTYENTVALRAVDSVDGMTADWVRLPYDVMDRVSRRIINEVRGVNRVVYDISSKPPSTIEWE